jgi:hypothetical protein
MQQSVPLTLALAGSLALLAGCDDGSSGGGSTAGGGDSDPGNGDTYNPVPEVDTSQLADSIARSAYESYREFGANHCVAGSASDPEAGCWLTTCAKRDDAWEQSTYRYRRILLSFDAEEGVLRSTWSYFAEEGCPVTSIQQNVRMEFADRDYSLGEPVSSGESGTTYPMDAVYNAYDSDLLAGDEQYTLIRLNAEGDRLCLPAPGADESRVEESGSFPYADEEGQRPTTIDPTHCLERA